MNHLVLLGDSILDNAAYVPGRPAVVNQVRNRMPAGWEVSLCARDGSVINDVHRQLASMPAQSTHLVVSAGGNHVLFEAGILQEAIGTVGEGLRRIAEVRSRFEDDYRRLLQSIAERRLPTIVCAIYNPCSPDELLQREMVTALSIFNDGTIAEARKFGFPVIDLRAVCTEAADFANEIEPSSQGGAKIADAIWDVLLTHPFSARRSTLFPAMRGAPDE